MDSMFQVQCQLKGRRGWADWPGACFADRGDAEAFAGATVGDTSLAKVSAARVAEVPMDEEAWGLG